MDTYFVEAVDFNVKVESRDDITRLQKDYEESSTVGQLLFY